MTPGFDVVVVGGAVVGSAAAYFLLADRGFTGSVLVIDRDLGYRDCATTRSLASIRHQFSTAENIRLSRFGSDFIAAAGETLAVDGDLPPIGFRESGYLFLASDAGREVLEANVAVQRREGAEIALLPPDGLRRRFPWLHVDDLAAGSLGLRGEGWLDAHALLHAFKRKAQRLGAVYRQANVAALVGEGRRVVGVRLDDGTRIDAGCVVVAAGTGAAAVAASAGIRLPVEPRKRCVFHFRSPLAGDGCPLVIDPSGLYFRPEGAGWLCGISPAEADDPPCTDFEVDATIFDDVLWPLLAARVPAFESLRLLGSWAGHYDVHPLDHNAIVGAHPDVDGLLFANGFSGHGLQHAPGVGRAIAELVVDGRYRSIDLAALGWERVIAGRPLRETNVV